jgi:ribonuclease HII
MKICGIDEAGRGPVIGPLVICAYCIEEEQLSELQKLGVKDSKLLSAKQRESLLVKLKKLSKDFKLAVISAKEIDSRNAVGTNLNQLEALKIAELLDDLRPDVAYVDSPTSPKAEKFAEMIMKTSVHKKIKIIAEHKADTKYPVVSAASIVAKVTRDEEIEIIKGEIGADFGSGYPADPVTIKFVREHWENSLAQYIRKSWGTIKELEKAKKQKTLAEFED